MTQPSQITPHPPTPAPGQDPGGLAIPFPFRGVFSEIITKTVGFGATKRKEKKKVFWYLERDAEGRTTVRALNREYLPTGEPREVPLQDVVDQFYPEPGIYMEKVAPRMREVERLADEGDEHRAKEEFYSAEYAYRSALTIDEDHIRANFGLGLTYLHLDDKARARHTFRKIVSMTSAFAPQHKHLFNEFGISLRKSGLFKECLEYYTRALELHAQDDDHLLFNIARAHFHSADYAQSVAFSLQALEQNPELREARQLREAAYAKDPALRSRDEGIALDLTGETG
ncbi:tetratricopeptide repeat protein [Desulfocurvus vexinensis]|uniref:tetratricopeptide repeat protein n=1 Tax=Desulfocurvus vexinensis TaxID=399548 RepID=UPI0004B30BDF|nr:tetratricopeptide repeat protein [Desulfocurvus vexinensis]